MHMLGVENNGICEVGVGKSYHSRTFIEKRGKNKGMNILQMVSRSLKLT